ncbi:MAG: SulP family inorganic anion transporter [Rikenellaceae bacterium]
MKLGFEPILVSSLRGYNREKFVADLLSGVIVGIVALPLAIAFAIASGVSPQVGLITAIIGGFVVAALGGCSVQISGPTGSFLVIICGIIQQFGVDGLLVVTMLAGLILIIMGSLKLGSIIKFIPYPINVGFTSGIAITIFSTQITDLFGLTTEALPGDFIGKWSIYLSSMNTMIPMALIFGVATMVIIAITPYFSKRIPGSLVAIVIMTALAYILKESGYAANLETIGDRFTIDPSFPKPSFPSFNFEMINDLLPSALTIALLVAIESLMSAAVADGATGERHDSNMELIAQGTANIISPLFGGIPVTGAVARTMTNVNNGGRTPISGMVHGATLLLILICLAPLAQHIPMACLAGVLGVVSYKMSDWRTFKRLLSGSKSDVSVLVATFLLTVFFDLTIAIMTGLLLAMLLFLRRVAEVTSVSVSRNTLDLSNEGEAYHSEDILNIDERIEVYHIDGPFFFGVANKFDSVMMGLHVEPKVRVIRMKHVPFIDSTGLYNLTSLIKSSQNANIKIILSGVNPKVRKALLNANFEELVGAEYICDNIEIALQRANETLAVME